jgi:hypothetical protein
VLIAAAAMAVVVRGADLALAVPDRDTLAVLMPVGIASYLMMCWLMDVANSREYASRTLLLARSILGHRDKRLATPAAASAKEPNASAS